MRKFHVTFLRSHDMNNGEIFSTVVCVSDSEVSANDIEVSREIEHAVNAIDDAYNAYAMHCRVMKNEPEKISSFIMTEVL